MGNIPLLCDHMVRQTDPELSERFHKWGCNLLCHYAIAQLLTNKLMSPYEIENCTNVLQNALCIDKELSLAYPTSPQRAINMALVTMRDPLHHADQVGSIERGKVSFWGWVKTLDWQYSIKWGQTKNGNKHFILCNWELQEIFNPYPGADVILLGGYLLYKVFSD